MKTIKKIPYEPVILNNDQYVPEKLEQGKVYISEEYGVAIHLCLCGCGEKVVMPIGGKDDWRIIVCL